MTEITVKLEDEMVKDVGRLYIRNFIEKQMEYLCLIRQMDKVEEQIKISGIDYDQELENIRQKAWHEYKGNFVVE